MIITTTDPITGEEIRNPQFKPFVIEGRGHLAVKIHFESEETRQVFLDIPTDHPFRLVDNPTDEGYDEG